MTGIGHEEAECLFCTPLDRLGQCLEVPFEALSADDSHACRSLMSSSTFSNGPLTLPALRSASASRSFFCQGSSHHHACSGSMRPALAATRASSLVSPLAEARSTLILAILALAFSRIRCSFRVRRAAGT